MRKSSIDYFDLARFGTGPQLVALRHLRERAGEIKGTKELRTFLDSSIAADEALFQDEQRWRGRRREVQHGDRAMELDRRVGKVLSGVAGILLAQQNLALANPEQAKRCEAMAKALFPNGIGAVTSLRFADQSQAIHVILKQVEAEPGFQSLAGQLGFAESLDLLRALNADYAREISAHNPLDFSKIQAERRLSRVRLGGILARIFGLFPDETDDQRAARDRLLEPIERQNKLQRAENRRYRNKAAEGADDDEAFDDEASTA